MTLANVDLILEYVRTVQDQQRIIQQLASYVDAANNRITDVVTAYITEGIFRENIVRTSSIPNVVNTETLLRRNTTNLQPNELINQPSTPNRTTARTPRPAQYLPSSHSSPPHPSPPESRGVSRLVNNTNTNSIISSPAIQSTRYILAASDNILNEEVETTEVERFEELPNSTSIPAITGERYSIRSSFSDNVNLSPTRRVRRPLDTHTGRYSTRANIQSDEIVRSPRVTRNISTVVPRRIPYNARRNLITNYLGGINEIIPTNLSSPVRIRPTIMQIRNNTELLKWEDISGNHQECCPIDLNTFNDGDDIMRINSCQHIFREMNLRHWLRQSPRCPICRFDLRDSP